jgi:hypothetical protein
MELPDAPSTSTHTEEIKVFISGRQAECEHCRQIQAPGSWITLVGDAGARCLPCGDLDELVFLPAGNAALTRRARAHSALSAFVLKWSRSRKRYERQGLLVQETALLRAEEECLADEPLRARRREREAIRHAGLDQQYVVQFAARIRELYPACPRDRETVIAEHACLKNSGRVGRSAAAKVLDEEAVHLAVRANIRHQETRYEELLGRGWQRERARDQVRTTVDQIAARWQARP